MQDESTRNDAPLGGSEGQEAGGEVQATPEAATAEVATPQDVKKRGQPRSSLRPFSRSPKSERTIDEVRVADGALASIIGLAAHEVPGVVGMAPASISEGIRRILGARQVDEGVVIEHPRGAGRADVDIHVVVAYGVNIPVVADSIRERVRYSSETLAGVVLDEVRVHVAGISRG